MEDHITEGIERRVDREELIAIFGEAKLVKVNGRIQLRGGPMSDRMEALEWVSLFLPGEIIDETKPSRPRK